MSQRAGNDSVTTAQAVLRMGQVATRSIAPRTIPYDDAAYAATTTRDSVDTNASDSTRPS
jgi:hypothetical protein